MKSNINKITIKGARQHNLKNALAIQDPEGITLGSELKRIEYNGTLACSPRPIAGFIETHIEQGPILEMDKKNIV